MICLSADQSPALALIAARLDGKDISTYGLHLHQALLLSPTIFPVIFAALMGRCFKAVGLYLVERGTTLGRLEQLIGCQSLFSSLERQISLRSWSFVGFLLMFLWLLSPLGGQSALRLLDQESGVITSVDTFHYMNPNAIEDSLMMGASAINSGRATFTSIFLAALLSSTRYQNTSMDLWGNVKLPSYRSVENSTSGEWKTLPMNTEDVIYASLIGIPVAGLHQSGSSNFTLKARQWDISCNTNKAMGLNESAFGNATATYKLAYSDGKRCTKYPCPISFKSINSDDDVGAVITVASCEMSYEYLQAVVRCNGTNCAAIQVRKLDLYTDGYTQDMDDFTRGNLVGNSFGTLPIVDNYNVGSITARGSTNAEKWMYNPTSFIGDTGDYAKLYKLSTETLSERLNMIFNTFFQSTYGTTALGGNLPKNLTSLSSGDPHLLFNSTTAQTSNPSSAVYKTNWNWFALLLISSIILQIAAYLGLILKYWTCVPDIIGYASSMTLLNPYVPTPTGGTTLHGLERAALLQDLPVRIGDVCADEPVGAIAFAKADEGRVARLDRKRFYI